LTVQEGAPVPLNVLEREETVVGQAAGAAIIGVISTAVAPRAKQIERSLKDPRIYSSAV
jgi:hypothetical protein